jgi:hypothetical protein
MAKKSVVSGKVTYSDDPAKPVNGALVEARIKSEDGSIGEMKGQDTTSGDGKYTLRLADGEYVLKAALGNQEVEKEITVADQNMEVNFSFESPPEGQDEFDLLYETIKTKEIEATVSIDEAKQLRRLYTVGNYLLGKLPQSIRILKDDLGNNGRITSILYDDVLEEEHDAINEVIEDMANKNKNDDLSMERVLSDLREQCDLGTSAVEEVNVEFKSIFKEFVSLCTEEMLAITPEDVDANKLYFDAKKKEERNKFLKKLISVIIKLTRNMSVAGGMGTKERVNGWAGIINNAVKILFETGKKVHSHNQDERHGFSLLAKLNEVQKSEIKPYLVHAKEGGSMLKYTIDIYVQLEKDRLKDEKVEDDTKYISELLHGKRDFEIDDKTASVALKSIATTVLENWPPDWS